jgi:hydrogenase maturation protease
VVIGFGNTLRRDDAVGYQIARDAERLWSPRIRAIALEQLTVEIAAELAETDQAIFVDARPAASSFSVCAEVIEPLQQESASLVHAITPRFLLSLCQALYGRCPRSWIVSVPAADFRFGEGLSAIAQEGILQALTVIETLIGWPEPHAGPYE